ncbi:hypothetical protein DXG03_006325 [Asterophora parasitica]|uniref:Uncharacterized protein n=1 Tax=Asterophora parasitica TaxID=117018 RepID=A0A9P7GE74_9AGAR|nr:hypothetical protein DXG03_006325 [Asterophora parasitica]
MVLYSLRIDSYRTPPRPLLTVAGVVTMLNNLPNLQTLWLEDILDSVPTGTATLETQRLVDLPHLSSITLNSGLAEGCHLLDHILIPPKTALTLFYDRAHPRAPERVHPLAPLLTYIADAIHNGLANPFLRMTLAMELQLPEFEFQLFTHEDVQGSDWCVSLSATLQERENWNFLLDALPLESLLILDIRVPGFLTYAWWSRFMDQDRLHTAILRYRDAHLFNAMHRYPIIQPAFPGPRKLKLLQCR